MAWFVIAGVLGTCIGSLISVIVERLGVREGIIVGRSECPSCRRVLHWYELIPIVSFVIQRGRCRGCSVPISWRYPVMEVVCASAFVLFAHARGFIFTADHLVGISFLFIFLVLLFFDARHHLLPTWFMVVGALLALAWRIFSVPGTLVGSLAVAFFMAACFAILSLVSHERWAGWGDSLLMSFVGLSLGWPAAAIAAFGAVWAGALWGLLLIALGRATRTSPVPFGAFVSVAALLGIIYPHVFNAIAAYPFR